MADLASLVVEVDARQVAAAQRTLEQFNATAGQTDKAVSGAARSVNAAAQTMSQGVNRTANSFGLMRHQTQNLAQQMQDLVVSLGSGQSAFTVLLQQGPQITSAMGGVSNALNIVGQGIARIGPIGVSAFGAAAAAATGFFASLKADQAEREFTRIADSFKLLA